MKDYLTVGELIEVLSKQDKNMAVGMSVDSEGNGFSLIPKNQFFSSVYLDEHLGFQDELGFRKEYEKVKTFLLWGSN